MLMKNIRQSKVKDFKSFSQFELLHVYVFLETFTIGQ